MPQPPQTSPEAPADSAGPAETTGAVRHHTVRAQLLHGVKEGSPIFLGYLPVGMAFGILAVDLGFTVVDSIVCSATALAGAGQFIALSLLRGGATALSTVLATAVVNLRYLLFGTTLSPHLREVRTPLQTWLAFTLTDETFAVNIAEHQRGTATGLTMAGVGFIAWVGWILGTVIGALGAQAIGDPGKWGVEFAMPAMFAALFVALAEDRRHVLVGIAAALVAIALPALEVVGLAIPSTWFVVIAAMTAATLATVVFRES